MVLRQRVACPLADFVVADVLWSEPSPSEALGVYNSFPTITPINLLFIVMSQTLPADPFSQASEQVLLDLPIICTFAFNTFRWATAVDGRGYSFIFFSYEVVGYIIHFI